MTRTDKKNLCVACIAFLVTILSIPAFACSFDIKVTPRGFLELCATESLDTIKALSPAIVNAHPALKYMALANATLNEKKDVGIVEYLLDSGCPAMVNSGDVQEKFEPVLAHFVIKSNSPMAKEVIGLLAKRGFDMNTPSSSGFDVLTHAILAKVSDDIVDVIIGSGVLTSRFGAGRFADCALAATGRNRTDYLEKFLKLGLDPNALDEQGKTLLFHACEYSATETVQYLVDHGADVSLKVTDAEDNALMNAVKYGRDDIVGILVRAGADVKDADVFGNNSLMVAAFFSEGIGEGRDIEDSGRTTPKTIRLLAKLSPDSVKAKNDGGETALHCAVRYNKFMTSLTIRALLDVGVDPNAKDNNGKRAIDYIKDDSTFGDNANPDIIRMILSGKNGEKKEPKANNKPQKKVSRKK